MTKKNTEIKENLETKENSVSNDLQSANQPNFQNNPQTSPQTSLAIGKVVCVGRNYAAHARELGNDVPSLPLFFMKPASCVTLLNQQDIGVITRPDPAKFGDTHYEAELCIQLSRDLTNASISEAKAAIGAVTLGLDLTLRELQTRLRDKGDPWERSKCFDGACVLGDWLDAKSFGDFKDVHYQLLINDNLVQDGDSSLMLFPVLELIAEISQAFSLKAGDVIMTGTPSGVGALVKNDHLQLILNNHRWQATVE